MSAPAITVLTATFNRADKLPRLYESLRAQTFPSFEWLVVDDGSSDGTAELVARFAEGAAFPVRYLRQENSGKHVALNRGAAAAAGFHCALIDSDDWYLPQALARLTHWWQSIPPARRAEFASVEARCVTTDGALVGEPLERDVTDSDYYEANVLRGMRWDTKGMHRTDVLRAHPFPEELGRFVTEAIVLYRIAARYRTRYVSEVIACNEYLPGGLTDSRTRSGFEASAAALALNRELLAYRRPMPLRRRLRTYANYTRNATHERVGWREQAEGVPSRWWWSATAGLGLGLYARDRWRATRA